MLDPHTPATKRRGRIHETVTMCMRCCGSSGDLLIIRREIKDERMAADQPTKYIPGATILPFEQRNPVAFWKNDVALDHPVVWLC